MGEGLQSRRESATPQAEEDVRPYESQQKLKKRKKISRLLGTTESTSITKKKKKNF